MKIVLIIQLLVLKLRSVSFLLRSSMTSLLGILILIKV